MLTHRGRRILFALVSEFLSSGEPVSSQSLTGRHGIELSSASIRAVFAELEGQGFLLKPHTSAGRIPTGRGLRAFVDALLASREMSAEVREAIDSRYANVAPGRDAALRHTGRVLAEVTGAVAVVVSQPTERWLLKDLRFISVKPTEILAVIVGGNGAVQNRMLRVEAPVSPSDLERANNIVAALLEGRTLAELREALALELESERAHIDVTLRLALTLGERALAESPRDANVVIEGHAQLIGGPEFADIDRARQALRTLEDKELLVQLLDRTLDAPGIHVRIGTEDETTTAGDLSVVATGFGSGSIGVIGSSRMDYPSVVPAVRYAATLLERLIDAEVDES